MEEAYNAHIAAASGLSEAQTRLMDARRRVAVLDGELCAAKAEQQKMVVDLDRKRRAARDAETAFYDGVARARDGDDEPSPILTVRIHSSSEDERLTVF